MDWSELVGTKVQLPPPNHEATAEPVASAEPTQPSSAPTKTGRGRSSSAARENPLFTGAPTPNETAPAFPSPDSNSGPPSGGSATTVSSLLTVPTLMNLTFATTLITLLWKLFQRWFGTAAGQWVPLLCCLLFVGISWLLSYGTARTNPATKLVTALVAVLTGFILTATVIGIDVAILRPGT